MANKCKYFEWDESGFTLPEKYYLEENADLADALNVFWSAGGLDFFNVVEAEYYSTNWLDFIGTLYCRIEAGEFVISDKHYNIPLIDEDKMELLSRGVPSIFVTDLKRSTKI